MNEVLIIILLSILSSFIIFSLSYILIKKLRITHPKDKSRIYVVLIISFLILFTISISAISLPLLNQDINDKPLIINNKENYSLLFVMDETKIENDNNQETTNLLDNECNINSSCDEECSYSSYQDILSIIIETSENINNTISQIIKTNSTINSLNSNVPKNENLLYSLFTNNEINEKKINEKSPYLTIFLLFQLILLFLTLSYIIFTLFFNRKFILRNVNAQKCNDLQIIQIVNKLCKEIKVKTPKIYIFDGEPNAFVFGYPISLVISKKLIDYLSKEELEVAIRHELGHISNKDHLLKPLLQSIRIMFFYNPIVHILYSTIMKERELLADSKYIKSKKDKIHFMEILLKINDFSKNQKFFSNKIYNSSSLLLVTQKIKKLNIAERYNQLFSSRRKNSLFTTLICIIIIISNISIMALAQNNLLKNTKTNEKLEDNICVSGLENYFNNQNIKTIYILRFIEENRHIIDIIELKDNQNLII